MSYNITVNQLYHKLTDDDSPFRHPMTLHADFIDTDFSFNVVIKDIIGNILQNSVEQYLKLKNYMYSPNPNTQMPPDLFIGQACEPLEIKCFNAEGTPGFDIADFQMYSEELAKSPNETLSVKYIIIAYKVVADQIIINDIWLKPVWEIVSSSNQWALKLQIKRGVIHKIRPGKWYSTTHKGFRCFECKEDFLSAIEDVLYQYSLTRMSANTWRNQVIKNYKQETGEVLDIPVWSKIKDKYQ